MTFNYQSEDFEEPYIVTVELTPGALATTDYPGHPPGVEIIAVLIGNLDLVDFISTELAESIAEYALNTSAERSS